MPHLQLNTALVVILRCIVGVILLVAGLTKLPMHSEWVEMVLAYKILPLPIFEYYAWSLPWLEITVGTCLILGLLTRLSSLAALLMIASFTVGNVMGFLNDISVEDCGCFGSLFTMTHRDALIIDSVLFIAALLTLFQRRHVATLGSLLHSLRKSYRTEPI